jgi:hypothetical protein
MDVREERRGAHVERPRSQMPCRPSFKRRATARDATNRFAATPIRSANCIRVNQLDRREALAMVTQFEKKNNGGRTTCLAAAAHVLVPLVHGVPTDQSYGREDRICVVRMSRSSAGPERE